MENKLQSVTSKQEEKLRKNGFDWCDETPTVALALKWFDETRNCYYNIELIQFDHNERDPKFPLVPKLISDIRQFDAKSKTFYCGTLYKYGFVCGTPHFDTKEQLENELLDLSIKM